LNAVEKIGSSRAQKHLAVVFVIKSLLNELQFAKLKLHSQLSLKRDVLRSLTG